MKDPKATVRLTEKTLRDFKTKLAKNGQTMQEVLEMAVKSYLMKK